MTEEKVLIDVSIDEANVNKAVTAVKDAKNQLEALKKVQKDLETQGLKNTTMYIKNEAEIKKLNGTVNENTKILTANNQIQAAQAGSLDQMKAGVQALTVQYNQLSEKERNNAEIGGKLASQIRIMNDQITAQKEKLGATTGVFGQFGSKVQSAVGANKNLAVAQEGLNTVMKANPIFLVVALLGQLFAALSKNEKVMDFIEPILSAINAGFKVLGDIVLEISGPLKAVFENPKQALLDLVDLIKNNLINRLTAFKVILDGILELDPKKLTDGFLQASTGIENATDKIMNLANATADYAERVADAARKAHELEEAQDALNEAMLESNELAEKNQKLINQLDQASRDKTATDASRIAALKELNKVEDETFNAQLKNAREQQRILEDQAKLATQSEDEQKKLSEARIKVYQLEAEQVLRAEKNANRVKKLQDEIIADQQRVADKKAEQIQKEKEALAELEEFRLETNVKAQKTIEDRVKAEVQLETFRRETLLANTQLTETEKQLVIEKSQATITAINQKGIDDRKAADQKAADDAKKALDQQLADAVQKHTDNVQALINAEKQKYLEGTINKEQYEQSLNDLELAGLIAEQGIKQQFGEQDLELNQQILDAKIAQKEEQVQNEIALEQMKLSTIKSILGNAAELFNKQSVAYKALASAQTLITTYQGAMEAYKSLSGIPIVGPALGAVAAALVTARGLQNVAKINSTQPTQIPKAEHGIMLDIGGKDHSQGGTNIAVDGKVVANAQKGEKLIVMKREATPLLRSLSTINKMAGGLDFFSDRRPRTHLADGGFVSRTAANAVTNTNQSALVDEFRQAVTNIKIVTRWVDYERTRDNVNATKVTSELG